MKNPDQWDRVVREEKDMKWDRWAGARLSRPFRLGQVGSFEQRRTGSHGVEWNGIGRPERKQETLGDHLSSSHEAVAYIVSIRDQDVTGTYQGTHNVSCCCYYLKL